MGALKWIAAALVWMLAMPASGQSPPAERGDGLELPTVVVVARRIEEDALRVPISLTVVDGPALAAAGLISVTDLPERVTGLTVSMVNPRLTSFSIRGLGSSSFNEGLESSVGVFVDGVYLGRQGLSIFDLVDIDRIEVLRGPQGTLFGKNTTAGAIQILTRLPSQTFGTQLEAAVGNHASRQLRGTVTGPLLDETLAGRLTGYYSARDGLVSNLFDGRRLNDRDKAGLRGQLLWTPAEHVSARLIAEIGRAAEDCCALPLVAPVRPAVRARDEYLEYQRVSLDPADRLADTNIEPRSDVEQEALSVEVNWVSPERQQFTSISAFRDWRFVPLVDDATALRLVSGGIRSALSQFSQELRLHTLFNAFESTLGLFYLHQTVSGNETGLLGDQLAQWVFGGLLRERVPAATYRNSGLLLDALIPPESLDGTVVRTPFTQTTDSLAGFGSIQWQLRPDVVLETGLRYTYEWKDARVTRTRTGGNPDASILSVTNVLTPLGDLIGQDLGGATFDGLLDSVAGGEFSRDDRREEGNVSARSSLLWSLADDLSLYGSAARGYKSGGINLGVTSDAVQPTFRPEIATAFEIGAKASGFDRRLSVALAVFHTRVEDYQALTFDEERTLIPNPRQTNLLNVGEVRLRGVELEGTGLPGFGLLLRAGVSYNDAITTDFRNAPDEDTRLNGKDLSGERLYNAPRWTGNAGLEHTQALGSKLELTGALDHSFRTGAFATVERGRASFIDGYGLTNLRIGLRDPLRRWELGLWARNVFDTDYTAAVQVLYGVGDYGASAGDPRTYGATLRLALD